MANIYKCSTQKAESGRLPGVQYQPTIYWVRSYSKRLKKKEECLHSSVKAKKERCRDKEEREANPAQNNDFSIEKAQWRTSIWSMILLPLLLLESEHATLYNSGTHDVGPVKSLSWTLEPLTPNSTRETIFPQYLQHIYLSSNLAIFISTLLKAD